MSNSGAPIGGSGREELKVVKSDQVEKLLEKYLEEFSVNSMTFNVSPKVSKKEIKSALERAEIETFEDIEAKGKKFDSLQINAGPTIRVAKAPKEKVAKKVAQLKKEKAEKRKEKPDDKDER